MKETQKRSMCRQCCPEALAAPYCPSRALHGFAHLYLYLCPLSRGITRWGQWPIMLAPLTVPSMVRYTGILNRDHFSLIVLPAPFRLEASDEGANPQNNSGHC